MFYNPFINYPSMPISGQLEETLDLIRESVQGEKEDELFYNYLIDIAPTKEEKEIILTIKNDEMKHNKMFRKIYREITGMEIESPNDVVFEKPNSYLDGIKKALFGELKAVEKYRVIREGLQSRPHRDMLFEIITDELKHASKYNYLYTLGKTSNTITSNNPQNTSTGTKDFTPDEWVKYITPLVTRALAEYKGGINLEHLFQEFILSGVFVGLGDTPQEAIEKVEHFEETGESKLLAESKAKPQ